MALGTRQRNASPRSRAAAGVARHLLAPTAAALLLTSCATLQVDPLPDPIRPPRTLAAEATEGAAATAPQEEGTTITETPGVVIQRTVAEGIADRLGEDLVGPPIAVSFHDVPLVTFINEVFAERLGMSFTLSAGLAEKTDLVTLRLTEPVPPNQLFATARRVLGDHGVNLREAEGVLTFAADQEIGAGDIPLLISGRALPEVPPTHRTAFQLVPMRVGRASDVANFLSQAFTGQDLDIRPDIPTNTLLLRGTVEMLGRAAEMIEVLDQPLLRGRHGVIIDPSFLAAADMAEDLAAVLRAEGHSVGTGGELGTAVILLPLRGVNKLVAFAADTATLAHVREWVRTLDAQKEATVENAVFTYEVRNTQAASMQETLDAILMDGGTSAFQGVQGAATETATTAEDDYLGTGRIVVDQNRNMLLFRGSGKEWAELRAVIEQLDKPVPSVLIELLIAEITLSDEEESGVEFLFRNGIGGDNIRGGTLGALGLQSKGLSMTLDSAGTTRAVLNLFYEDSRVAIRSSARLMVKSGENGHLRRRQRDPHHQPTLGRRYPGRGLHQRPPAGDVPQDRRAARDRARRAGQRPGRSRHQPGAERGPPHRGDEPGRHADHPLPQHLHEPHPAGRRLPADGRPRLEQPERGRGRRARPRAGARARSPVPQGRLPAGPHGARHPLILRDAGAAAGASTDLLRRGRNAGQARRSSHKGERRPDRPGGSPKPPRGAVRQDVRLVRMKVGGFPTRSLADIHLEGAARRPTMASMRGGETMRPGGFVRSRRTATPNGAHARRGGVLWSVVSRAGARRGKEDRSMSNIASTIPRIVLRLARYPSSVF